MSKKNKVLQSTSAVESEKIDWAAIAAAEKAVQQAEVAEVSASPEAKISYDEWWMSREQAIAKPKYYKEIIRVDAKARGLGKLETSDRWDWAAKQFGLVL